MWINTDRPFILFRFTWMTRGKARGSFLDITLITLQNRSPDVEHMRSNRMTGGESASTLYLTPLPPYVMISFFVNLAISETLR